MAELSVFVSVGTTATPEQEDFVRAVEDRLRSEGIVPQTVGRNTFSSDAPLKAVTKLMEKCSGAVVIALERTYFPAGIEKRGGPQETAHEDILLPTPFNQIEAAMAYSRGIPLMVIVENGLKSEGLLQQGYDWYVQMMNPEVNSLHSNEFNGVLANWKEKMMQRPPEAKESKSANDMTIGQLVGGLKPAQLWSLLTALGALIGGAFALGVKLGAL